LISPYFSLDRLAVQSYQCHEEGRPPMHRTDQDQPMKHPTRYFCENPVTHRMEEVFPESQLGDDEPVIPMYWGRSSRLRHRSRHGVLWPDSGGRSWSTGQAMKRALAARLSRLEPRTVSAEHRVTIRFGHLKRLPPGYVGERHTIVAREFPSRRPGVGRVRGGARARSESARNHWLPRRAPDRESPGRDVREGRSGSMRTAQIQRRLKKLSIRFRPSSTREFTLEQLCRLYWRMDRSGFRALADEVAMVRPLLGFFEREDGERQRRGAPR
jgi:hypothetical protein